ncbi:TonB-dependent receptor [Shimwellia blattae]|nr:TonB-dependent siderophore receptor [Shimwellia blattae]VDY62643.1 Ferrichrome receptor FcuA precursor [Shimwellia blattae]VEC19352.1 Ferrichrome receptor FcuA precursor [Shimwellia blattae]
MRTNPSSAMRVKPRLLAVLISSATFPAVAATASADASQARPNEETVVVTAAPDASDTFTAGGDQLVPAFLDGQIANGGRMGMLGEQKAMDVPFSVIGYTSKLVEDQQAHTIADVVANDAGVQSTQGYGNFAETYRIRGFTLDGDDMTLGGLSGIVPRQVMDTQMLERIEVFKGANSLMNGASSTGVGGMINLEPKRAESIPVTRVGVDYTSDSQLGGNLDVGRRFGDNDQFGVRVNLLHREGGTTVDNDRRRTTLASVGLDYKGERLRSSLDFGYQKKTFHGSTAGINITNVDFIPSAPGTSHNYSQKWAWSDIENEFGMLKSEYDLLDNNLLTAYGALGGQHAHEQGTYSSPKLIDGSGAATAGRLDTNRISDTASGMAGLRSQFATGPVSHKVNVGYAAQTTQIKTAWGMAWGNESPTNIYDTHAVPMPDNVLTGGKNYTDPLTTERDRSQGWLLSDTLGVLDDSVLLTLGARHQKVVVTSYNVNTGKQEAASSYSEQRWMPTYGIVYKPWESVSLYANHTEALQPGGTGALGTVNYGQSLGIVHSKQNEVGVKLDFGRVGGSVALFEIKKPSVLTTTSNNLSYSKLDGEQRNRGLELNAFGEPVLGLRLNGGATWMDPELTKTQDGINNGNDAIGVPRFTAVFGAEYDIAQVPGLTATGRVNHTGSQYADSANTKKLSAYTTLDLGMRYRMQLNEDKNEMVVRVGLDNVTNKKYWSGVDSTSGIYLFQGQGRTLKASLSYDF